MATATTSLWLLATCVIAASCAFTTRDAQNLTLVQTQEGPVKGELVTGADGIQYFSFKGIPYAKPPLGSLRFKNPEPAAAWHGSVRAAVTEGAKCFQLSVPQNRVEGAEDCLYLNVYSRWLGAAKLPVMVFIHGGDFVFGSGTLAETGPEFLVFHDVVLVTINYRLGAFGFLSLDSDDIPGNMGLKDQALALRWVQRNIAAFGGDPAKVTLFGESAGAMSTHFHTLVKSSQGLFRAVILQSGNALTNFAYQETHLDMARLLYERLANSTKVVSPDQMVATFRKASSAAILDASMALAAADPRLQLAVVPFLPSPERRKQGSQSKFLTRDPESLVRNPEVPPVPTIAGITGNEGITLSALAGLSGKPELVASLKKNPQLALPANLAPFPDTAKLLGVKNNNTLTSAQAARAGQKIKNLYNFERNESNFIQFFGDLSLAFHVHRLVDLTLARHGPDAPLFLYHFLEVGDYNWATKTFNFSGKAATHADELGYMLSITTPANFPKQTMLDRNSASSRTLSTMSRLWTNFAKVGNPGLHGWVAASSAGDAQSAPYAKLSDATMGSLGKGLGGAAMPLFDDLFALTRATRVKKRPLESLVIPFRFYEFVGITRGRALWG